MYFGIRMFCISVVIVMLSADLAWMYALIKKVTTKPIFSTSASLRLQSYFRLFLLHGHLEVMRTINIWTRYIGGYIQECTALCVKALSLDSLCTSSISRGHFFLTFEINQPQKQATLVGNWVSFGGWNHFWSYYFPCYLQYRVKLDRKISSW